MADRAKRILSCCQQSRAVMVYQYIPEGNAQSPNGFHLVACHPIGSDPVAVSDLATLVVNASLQLRPELVRRFCRARRSDDSAIEVRKRLANDCGNDDEGDQ